MPQCRQAEGLSRAEAAALLSGNLIAQYSTTTCSVVFVRCSAQRAHHLPVHSGVHASHVIDLLDISGCILWLSALHFSISYLLKCIAALRKYSFRDQVGLQSGPAGIGDNHLLEFSVNLEGMLIFSQLVQASGAQMGVGEAPFPTLWFSKKKRRNR